MPSILNIPSAKDIRKSLSGKRRVRPTWEMADYFPKQGAWTEFDYLNLPEDGPRAELVDGFLEMLPMPSLLHQRMAKFLFKKLDAFVEENHLGEVLYDGTRVKLDSGEFRLPDIVVSLKSRRENHTRAFYSGADLVVEVVSGTSADRERDLVEKRARYAAGKVAEYWIADPEQDRITVLALAGKVYAVHGEFTRGQKATSVLLKSFEVDVTETLAAVKFPK